MTKIGKASDQLQPMFGEKVGELWFTNQKVSEPNSFSVG